MQERQGREEMFVRGPVPVEREDDGFYAPGVWPTYGRPLRLIILGKEAVAVPTHWQDSRSRPCYAPSVCEGCAMMRSRRTQYHVAAWNLDTGLAVVLTLGTQGAARLLTIASAQDQLRGLEIVLHKMRERNRAGVEVDWVRNHDPNGKLRAEFPLLPQLRRLYGCDAVPLYGEEGGEG